MKGGANQKDKKFFFFSKLYKEYFLEVKRLYLKYIEEDGFF